jgi:hypothetical protein
MLSLIPDEVSRSIKDLTFDLNEWFALKTSPSRVRSGEGYGEREANNFSIAQHSLNRHFTIPAFGIILSSRIEFMLFPFADQFIDREKQK